MRSVSELLYICGHENFETRKCCLQPSDSCRVMRGRWCGHLWKHRLPVQQFFWACALELSNATDTLDFGRELCWVNYCALCIASPLSNKTPKLHKTKFETFWQHLSRGLNIRYVHHVLQKLHTESMSLPLWQCRSDSSAIFMGQESLTLVTFWFLNDFGPKLKCINFAPSIPKEDPPLVELPVLTGTTWLPVSTPTVAGEWNWQPT